MASRAKVAVIGLGAMGAAALYALSCRGVEAVGLEQFTPGHARGSSHGESRAFRTSYFEDPSYVPLARAARAAWRGIERRTGADLLTMTGIVEAGHERSEIVLGSLRASREHGLEHEVIDGAEVRRRCPALQVPADWIGIAQPDAGFLRPERAIAAMLHAARDLGASVVTDRRVTGIESHGAGVRLAFADGAVLDVDRVVIAAGAWMVQLVPELARLLTVTRQTLGWFEPRRPDLVAPGRLPVFVLDGKDDMLYGFPDFAGTGIKLASHRRGAEIVDSDAERSVDPADAASLAASVARYLPEAAGRLTQAVACSYTRTPDEHFLIDRHPRDERIVIASPCSGHGFKFASVIGEILADLALDGGTGHDISLFRAARFGL